jgi:hypothetical protein
MVLLDLDDGRCLLRKRFGFLPLRWHPRFAFALYVSLFGVLVFALASAYCIRASCVAVWCFGLCAGIRVLPSCFMCRCLVFWPLRWHPRVAFVLQASPLCGAMLST